jgi:hypothetical protein
MNPTAHRRVSTRPSRRLPGSTGPSGSLGQAVECCSVEHPPCTNDLPDLRVIGDVQKRIGVEEDEIGVEAGDDGAGSALPAERAPRATVELNLEVMTAFQLAM